jgi:hypothetical protein
VSTVLDDARVTARDGGGYTVVRESGLAVHVLYMPPFRWCVCYGANLNFMPTDGGGHAIGFTSAEAAVGAVLT